MTYAPPFYRTSFSRHMHALAISGFFSRDLDCDDFSFIESVRERGCVGCGSLADTATTTCHIDRPVLLEELGYWHLPFGVDPSTNRRIAQARPKLSEQARTTRAAQRAADKAAMAAERLEMQREWERQRAEREQERERQLTRTMEADQEWQDDFEDARSLAPYDPPKPKKYSRLNRHYVPEWKREDQKRRQENREALDECSWIIENKENRQFRDLKQQVADILASQPYPHEWDVTELMDMTGCNDHKLFLACCKALIEDCKATAV